MPGWLVDLLGAAVAALVGGVATHWWKDTRTARQSAEHSGLINSGHCVRCKQEIEAEFLAGDERLDVLSRGVAFLLRQIPKLCEGVNAPGCKGIEREANSLADELLLAGKKRVK